MTKVKYKTVGELVEELKKLDQNLPVLRYDHEWGHFPVGEIKVEKDLQVNSAEFLKRVSLKKAVVL